MFSRSFLFGLRGQDGHHSLRRVHELRSSKEDVYHTVYSVVLVSAVHQPSVRNKVKTVYGPLGGVGGSSVIANGPHGGGARSSIRTCKSFTVFYVSMRPPCTDAEQRRHVTSQPCKLRGERQAARSSTEMALQWLPLMGHAAFHSNRTAHSRFLAMLLHQHSDTPHALLLYACLVVSYFFSGAVVLSCSLLSASMPVLSV